MTRDQLRAQHAYQCVRAAASAGQLKDYKILVDTLGANILRSGLAVAIATVEREVGRDRPAAKQMLDDLGAANIHGLQGSDHHSLGETVRSSLDLPAYLLATREALKVVTWFKRAVQALGS